MKLKTFTRPPYAARFAYRKEVNDYYVILSAFVEDEYGFTKMGLKPGNVAIDIGAHIGAATLLLAVMGLQVYAYEALRENYDLLVQNILDNGASKAHYHRRAVCDTNEQVTVHLGAIEDMAHRFMGNMYSSTKDTQLVPGTTLDSIFEANEIERCAVLKMDCEGAEWAILEAASDDTLSRIDRIVGEYHTVGGIMKTRAMMLDATRGMFEDVTVGEDPGGLGHFLFARRRA